MFGSNNKSFVGFNGRTEEVIVRTKKRKINGAFSAVGPLRRKMERRREPDIFDLLDQVSKGALSLFTDLKYNMDCNNNTVYYPTNELGRSKKEMFNRYLRDLRRVGIVKVTLREMHSTNPTRPYRFKKQTYIINPHLLKCWDFDEAELLWNQSK